MNVFEDLVVELKEENLLEDTVLDERPGSDEFGSEMSASRLESDPPHASAPDPALTEYDLQLPNRGGQQSVEPASAVTENVVVSGCTRRPLQSAHGSLTMRPSPRQRGHVVCTMKKPCECTT